MNLAKTGRITGALFLLAFVAYGGGSALVESLISGDDRLAQVGAHTEQLLFGAFAMLLNSVIVAAIGVLSYYVLRTSHPLIATGYLVARLAEAVILGVGIIALLSLAPLSGSNGDSASTLAANLYATNALAFQVAMLGLAIGSVFFCLALQWTAYVPRWLAIWGVVGYAIFGLGAALELLDLSPGMWTFIPGGLFEVALGITLLRRGFATSELRSTPPIAAPIMG